ncbi:hypothetical protein [Ureibacillus thermosphaericus]|uniref:Uncharacterized protein n=1 Tax=Ureibacillus thermosphaericus TaxID=51173 RepID=A0A840PT76_URETH|nr:hypothetical protein [Ureibacillus thermosphaericus]MBB5149090.1 hypothetical protein [Ureibacillus thermosphaericus]NKZ31854.1 hypothetical protein [Ureibacillus thermosphaericus]
MIFKLLLDTQGTPNEEEEDQEDEDDEFQSHDIRANIELTKIFSFHDSRSSLQTGDNKTGQGEGEFQFPSSGLSW